ncbi:TonB-dependent receptor [Thioalkalivibrio sulfidiphilus HL-EbGr7]|uniref:TonB-dependent receptor n=1 Tax=Thioalkalivibrio sulfidiphilus (strain HL-EbGR7) TaxID=396588 RepID=B8GPL8_THISH|nr:TonB-dependent receptor [Thioalkalivibrio sulfidiphilus]ACL72185.1 TonB-dependent receptor [Thioalkalivibrio sulfidiphilus HL-EbGr7]
MKPANQLTRILISILGAALTSLPVAQAQQDPLPTEHDFFMDLPVVLTATRLQQPVAEAPAAVTVIDRELIEASGARELVDILRLVPGMIVARHSNHEPVVTYGGLPERHARRMQVLVDGRSVYQPFDGGVFWTDLGLAIEDIERIEVIRGPNSAAYGPNSFLGVINIITRHPAEVRGHHVTSRLGTNGVRDLVARQSGGRDNLDYRLTLSTQEDNGFPDTNSDKRAQFANLRMDYRMTQEHSLTTQAGFGQSRKARGFMDNPVDPERRFTTDSAFVQMRLDRDTGIGESWSLQYYYQQFATVDEFNTGDFLFQGVIPLVDMALDFNHRTDRHDLEFEHRTLLSPGSRLIWGTGLRHDKVTSSTYFSERSPVSDDMQRVFGNLEFDLSAITTLNLGASYERSRLFGDQFSPRLALNAHPNPTHSFRFIASRATRTPSPTEELARQIYYPMDIFGNTYEVIILDADGGLKPERLEYYEIGHHYSLNGSRAAIDTKVFSNRITRFIDAINASRSFADRGGVAYQGIEMQLGYWLSDRTRLHGGLTYHFNRDDMSEQGDGRYGEAVPRRILNAAITSRVTDQLRLSSTYYHYSEVNWIDGAPTDAYDGFLDVSAEWTLNRHARLGVTVQDLLARGYDGRTPANADIY